MVGEISIRGRRDFLPEELCIDLKDLWHIPTHDRHPKTNGERNLKFDPLSEKYTDLPTIYFWVPYSGGVHLK